MFVKIVASAVALEVTQLETHFAGIDDNGVAVQIGGKCGHVGQHVDSMADSKSKGTQLGQRWRHFDCNAIDCGRHSDQMLRLFLRIPVCMNTNKLYHDRFKKRKCFFLEFKLNSTGNQGDNFFKVLLNYFYLSMKC